MLTREARDIRSAVRHDLVANAVRIADAASRWGVGEFGCMSTCYKAIFGGLPLQTVRLKNTGALCSGLPESLGRASNFRLLSLVPGIIAE
jgi:hypothetical protein